MDRGGKERGSEREGGEGPPVLRPLRRARPCGDVVRAPAPISEVRLVTKRTGNGRQRAQRKRRGRRAEEGGGGGAEG
eukprot:3582102-Pyramimonas_sp.AAC.1